MYRLRNIKSSIIICTTKNLVLKKNIPSDSWWCAHKFKITLKIIIFANNLTVKKVSNNRALYSHHFFVLITLIKKIQ